MFIEIIAKDINDIKFLNSYNIDRIEYCINLEKGGYTPLLKDIKQAASISKIPVNVIVRYSEKEYYGFWEFKKMLKTIKKISKTDINGIVIGALSKNKLVSRTRMNKIMKQTKKLKVTFHRAFDNIALTNKNEEMNYLNEVKVDSILTSGTPTGVSNNLKLLNELEDNRVKNNFQIKLLVGGGVNFENIESVKKFAKSIHIGSLIREDSSWNKPISNELLNKIIKTLK